MDRFQRIDAKIQRGRGKAARWLGYPFDVYRLSPKVSGQIVSGNPVFSGFKSSLTRWKSSKDIENQVFDALTFDAECDNRKLEIGDVLVRTGYRSDGAMFVVGDMRPLKHTILIRCEQSATITRPTTPASNAVLNTGKPTQIKQHVGVTKTTEQSLILTNGSYSFSATGSSAMVPFGLQPLNKLREMPESKLPTDTKRESFVGFLPLLPGVILEENDVISSGASGDRFRIEQNYIAEHGLQGQVLLLQKLTV